MTAPYIPVALRRQVRERADGRCEYCLLHEADAFFPHEPDHVVAVKHGGTTAAENLAYACFECNRHKGSDLASLDPHSGGLTPLFNPRRDGWSDHFDDSECVILARSPSGRVTASLLRINDPARVEVRRTLAAQGRWSAPRGDSPSR